MPTSTTATVNYARQARNRSRWLSQLSELIAFPTISALPNHHRNLHNCAQWLARHLAEIGLHHVRVLPGVNRGAPSVYADWLLAPGKPTLLPAGYRFTRPLSECLCR